MTFLLASKPKSQRHISAALASLISILSYTCYGCCFA